jgi:hypothetical protein
MIKISKQGKSVDSPVISDLSFNSVYSNLKIAGVTSGIATIVAGDYHSGFDPNSYTPTLGTSAPFFAVHYIDITGTGLWSSLHGCNYVGSRIAQVASVFSGDVNFFKVYISDFEERPYNVSIPIRTLFFYDKLMASQVDIPSQTTQNTKMDISKTGKNVFSGLTGDVALSMNMENLEVHMSGTSNIGNYLEINHNLGYVPLMMWWFKGNGSNNWWFQESTGVFETFTSTPYHGSSHATASCISSSKAYFYTGCNGSAPDQVKYIIFKNKIE